MTTSELSIPNTVPPIPNTVPHAPAPTEELTRRLDALSLQQALIDFELANARVLDLTARVVEATNRGVRLQAEVDALQDMLIGAHGELTSLRAEAVAHQGAAEASRARLSEIEGSRTYRALKVLGRARRFFA